MNDMKCLRLGVHRLQQTAAVAALDQRWIAKPTIRKILLTEWDPIGVSDIPEAQDEYDAYADTVCGMLANQTASVDAIAQYLFKIATEPYGAFIPRTC